ncbi:hypothetical protein NLJ89_g2242 [Agrocybe chaxingu]|uniref:Uncharacterized protein n=1 Tax=Agrocybe chaxingu TaxID=84603 RepID=A0A9W8MY77_9AGAR|nr:hypothetical protein NLJ89_g2242 [Agrocybe chaxingu]
MPSSAPARRGPDVPPIAGNEVVQAIMRLLHDRLPGVALAGAITMEVVHRAIDVLKKHILSILGTGFLTAALATLLPSLLVVAVNAIGFTAAGAFGATAAIASPAVIGVGVAFGVIGAGVLGYKWYERRQARRIVAVASGGSDDSDDRKETSERQVAVRQTANLFDLFRRRPKID